ncbi:MAG: OmpA family protein [Ignavibacteria bacterium]|nr:OmpA family protein [Ignavibacteria bacterium]
MIRIATTLLVATLFVLSSNTLQAQTRRGDVVGSIGYSALFYSGELKSDKSGDALFATLAYNTSDRFWIEGRIGFGTYFFQTDANLVRKYTEYYGPTGTLGGLYPGSPTKIGSQNSSSYTALDVSFGFVILKNASVTPFLTGGLGLVHFSPRNESDNTPLPNYDKGAYPASVASIPLGVGLLVPLSDDVSLSARYDHRFVFSGYLDDIQVGGANDGLSSISIGLAYRFNERPKSDEGRCWCELGKSRYDADNCAICEVQNCEICRQRQPRRAAEIADNREPAAEPAPKPIQPEPAPVVKEPEPEPTPKPNRKLITQGIRFNVNSDVIDFTDPTTKARMAEMVQFFNESCDELEALIEGHASVDGPAKRNQELSVLRARAVAKWLVDNGVAPEKIMGAIGYGSSMPRVPDPPAAAARRMTKLQLEAIREQNRRIELSILRDCE